MLHNHYMSVIGGHFMWIFWIIIIVAIIGVIYFISQKNTKPKSALDILKKRYAKGEISKSEFEEKKKGLETRE